MHDNIPTPPFRSHGATYHTDRTRKFFVSYYTHTTGIASSYGPYLDAVAVERISYVFKLPEDFVSIVACKIIMHTVTGSGNVVLDLHLAAGEIGESYIAENNSDDDNVISLGTNLYAFAADHATLFTGVTKDHYILFSVERDADHASDTLAYPIYVHGIEIEYTADM
jgi:hypothetical protein